MKREVTPRQKEAKVLTEPIPFRFQSERRLVSRKAKSTKTDATSKSNTLMTGNRRIGRSSFRDLRGDNDDSSKVSTNSSQHKVIETNPNTKPKPFKFVCDERHKQHSRALQEKIEQVKSETFRQFKAKPVPKSTFKANFSPMKINRPLIEPKGPNLRTDEQAKVRKEYDEAVRMKKEREEQIRSQFEEQKTIREEMEIKLLRRLPTSQGGFIPKAEPIRVSAGFSTMQIQRERSWSASSSENESRGTFEPLNGDASSLGGDTASGLRSLISGFRKVKLRDSSSVLSSSRAG
mmetsp:Transcript_5328/g.5002  ORF Transcript_5328/g.5002 Transcript_5328/m.5002 type:complete len:291 (+) Transcript_5328:1685-2557(+)